MNKETIEQIKNLSGVKDVVLVGDQYPSFKDTIIVVLNPDIDRRSLVEEAYKNGKLIEFSEVGKDNWKLITKPIFDWSIANYRIADPDWLKTVANMDAGLANRITKWFNGYIFNNEF